MAFLKPKKNPYRTRGFDFKKTLKILIIIILVIIAAFVALAVFRNFKQKQLRSEPIQTITAKAGATEPGEAVSLTVTAHTKSGESYILSADDYVMSVKKMPDHGAYVNENVTLKSDKTKTASCSVKADREKEESWNVGYQSGKEVQAILYDNGDLEFTGSGKIKHYAVDERPWIIGDDEENTGNNNYGEKIQYVHFADGVSADTMDYMFQDCTALTTAANIPEGVTSMYYTFSGCAALSTAPDLSGKKDIRNMDCTYQYCTSLTDPGVIPAGVMEMKNCYEGCTAIKTTASYEGTQLQDMTSAYLDCISLHEVKALPESVTSLESAFSGCTNLTEAPKIPGKTKTTANMFADDEYLKTGTDVPSSVTDMSGMYSGCRNLTGTITLYNAKCDNCDDLFTDAASTSDVLNVKLSEKTLNALTGSTYDDGTTTVDHIKYSAYDHKPKKITKKTEEKKTETKKSDNRKASGKKTAKSSGKKTNTSKKNTAVKKNPTAKKNSSKKDNSSKKNKSKTKTIVTTEIVEG